MNEVAEALITTLPIVLVVIIILVVIRAVGRKEPKEKEPKSDFDKQLEEIRKKTIH